MFLENLYDFFNVFFDEKCFFRKVIYFLSYEMFIFAYKIKDFNGFFELN